LTPGFFRLLALPPLDRFDLWPPRQGLLQARFVLLGRTQDRYLSRPPPISCSVRSFVYFQSTPQTR
jgi:hypothetical protein